MPERYELWGRRWPPGTLLGQHLGEHRVPACRPCQVTACQHRTLGFDLEQARGDFR